MHAQLPDWIDRRELGAQLRRTRGDEVILATRFRSGCVMLKRIHVSAFAQSDRRRINDVRPFRGLDRVVWIHDETSRSLAERLDGLLLVCTPPGEFR